MNKSWNNSLVWPLLLMVILVVLGLFTIQLNDHLFPWDERFHALVAYNLSLDWSFPTLYRENPLEHFNTGAWYKSGAWLHKPPLFSYQMALWMKLLGTEVWVIRVNSVFMLLVFAFSLFGMARLHAINRLDATILAACYSLSPILFSLISGRLGMDHNDINFLGHIALSFYFLERFRLKGNPWNAAAIGLFSAAAILTKWLPGLLVYLAFGLFCINAGPRQKSQSKALWRGLLLAISCTILLAGSWHGYAYLKFPEEWLRALAYNSQHFTEALEGHGQNWYFHLEVWFSYLFIPLILAALALLNHRAVYQKIYLLSFASVILFYSLAQTRLPAYTLIALVPLFAGSLPLFKKPKKAFKLTAYSLAVIAMGLTLLQLTNLYKRSLEDPERAVAVFYQELESSLSEQALIFNLPSLQYPQVMYYTGALAFDQLPDKEELARLSAEGYEVIIMNHADKKVNRQDYPNYRFIDYTP